MGSSRVTHQRRARSRGRDGGFTLLEVVLATAIVCGLLFAVLSFHHHASMIRERTQLELEEISAARLLMDRITNELRTAVYHDGLRRGIRGRPERIDFLTTVVPPRSAWSTASDGAESIPEFDLRRVRYRTRSRHGIVRDDYRLPTTTDPKQSRTVDPVSKRLHFLHFRYHDGRSWRDKWKAKGLPHGVEITLGAKPLPRDTDAVEYPYRMFRRVVHIPASSMLGATERSGS